MEKETEIKVSKFVFDVGFTARILWRHFNDMMEPPCQRTRHNIARVEIKVDGQKKEEIAKILEGCFIEEEDLNAIEHMLYDIQERATELRSEV